MTQRIVLASSNRGKLAEFNALLAQSGFEVVAQASLGIDDAEESGQSFVENALLK
ncbi:MAG: non-canonical purine NTP pyrophosphatase, partial [Rhodanobacter sp.]